MDNIKVTYELRRHDSSRFHGWIVWECSDGMESVYFQSTSLTEAKAVFNDLHAEVLQTSTFLFGCITSKIPSCAFPQKVIIYTCSEGSAGRALKRV